jgi:hypothetical protein
LHTKDGSSSKNVVDDYFLPGQIDPLSSFEEEDDEEEGHSNNKKKVVTPMKLPPLSTLLEVNQVFPSCPNPINMAKPTSQLRPLPTT